MNNDTRELSSSELDLVTGGNWFGAILGIVGNVAYDLLKKESASGFVADAVRQTGNTPGI